MSSAMFSETRGPSINADSRSPTARFNVAATCIMIVVLSAAPCCLVRFRRTSCAVLAARISPSRLLAVADSCEARCSARCSVLSACCSAVAALAAAMSARFAAYIVEHTSHMGYGAKSSVQIPV
jgi:hypothetical protein